MGDKSKIEWTDATWNPTTGCTKVSQGCKHCYAERFAKRLGYDFNRVELHADRLELPQRWTKPRRIFVDSMSDLFHEDVPDEFIFRVFQAMARAPRHIFQVLTKRSKRMYELVPNIRGRLPDRLEHVWLGVSVEDQATADERIPLLLQTQAAVRFVSCEPMLEEVKLGWYLRHKYWRNDNNQRNYIDWVICGGESGPGARPMHPDWARSLRDQCQAAGTPFFFKQWGEWTTIFPQNMSLANREMTYEHGMTFYRVGKKAAGRLLDGREWNEYPNSGQ